ncbi:M42 family metallopeptidase [Chelativorans salis]|uniref:M42 family metallopeptidase n=1 Tax=Chelativorans salis TaxID=2978478 RepID=A0ABT2LVD1_9HYPH|nr:M42 family metallopeptidase [Chelativorans sp. EGI FJ00035]MCT7378490.1 M42 family metallopeptidase [Chelativorans sp. EGI FJ00035]
MKERLRTLLTELMLIPGLSGHEGRVCRAIREKLTLLGLACRTDMLGNLIATIEGDAAVPSVMLLTHMDQLGFVVRKIEPDGFIRVERLGGVPERALASQTVLLCVGEGRDRKGVIANKSHHATTLDEKYKVVPYADLYIDAGFASAEEAQAAGVKIGTPVTYLPNVVELGDECIAGTAVDDRAGCAVLLEAARLLKDKSPRPTIHLVFAVQEEFNLRGAVTAAQALAPDIAIQIDLVLATDTPDMAHRGDVKLGGGPAMSLYSFHGRGTLNGLIPHPALVGLFENIAGERGMPLQRSAHVGALTETSYVQLVGEGVACIDMGFPMRYSHSSLEVCDLGDLEQLTRLLADAIAVINPKFSLDRDDYVT